jgi:hypothetical protein
MTFSALFAFGVFAFSSPVRAQGPGQSAQSPARERKPPQKENELGSYLAREASIRLPQRSGVRGGIEASGPFTSFQR